ncbi:MAG: hypothetical protein AB8B55_11950 [Mariniblastus sp.]
MHLLSRTALLACVVMLFAANGQAALSQTESSSKKTVATNSLEAAKELSAASGRPIFAIAGRST